MRKILFIIIACLQLNVVLAQSKKELEGHILVIEQKQRLSDSLMLILKNEKSNLQIENKSLQDNIKKLNESIASLTKNNDDFQRRMIQQNKTIENLNKSKDSLMLVVKEKEKIKESTSMIPKNESDSIVALIQSFYACENWEDRVSFVVNPILVKPLMLGHYMDNYRAYRIPKEDIFLQGSGYNMNDLFKVLWKDNLVYCKKTVDGFKIDWEATAGYNPVGIKTFKAGLSSSINQYRVTAEIDAYYNFSFIKAQDTHWSVRLVADESVAGYVLKSSPVGKRLNEILMDGKQHQVILELSTDPEQGNSGGTAVITRIVSESWSMQ